MGAEECFDTSYWLHTYDFWMMASFVCMPFVILHKWDLSFLKCRNTFDIYTEFIGFSSPLVFITYIYAIVPKVHRFVYRFKYAVRNKLDMKIDVWFADGNTTIIHRYFYRQIVVALRGPKVSGKLNIYRTKAA